MSSQTLDYQTTLDLLYSRIDYERNATVPARLQGLHLDRMRALLQGLGNPHHQLNIIHVAGTKGKGSTASMLSSVLSAAGYRTGLYTSPHLHLLEERMVVDGVHCQPDELIELVDAARLVIHEMDQSAKRMPWGKGPTFFEITTALAWLYFVRKTVDLAVVEVGMGGRLDSTNVCQPLVSIITSISFDHTRQLGNSLAAIAEEKAGIIKPGVPVVSGVVQPEPRAVIRAVAQERRCPLFEIGRDFSYSFRASRDQPTSAAFDYAQQLAGVTRCWPELRLSLLGKHQAANAAVALATLGCLEPCGWPVSETQLRQGLLNARCPARVEMVAQSPTTIVDTAHNHASVDALLETLNSIAVAGQKLLIFAATHEKDVRRMLGQLLPEFDQVVLTRYLNNPRSTPIAELIRLARQVRAADARPVGKPRQLLAANTPAEAWQTARRLARPQDLICVTGSFFLAAEMRPLIQSGEARL